MKKMIIFTIAMLFMLAACAKAPTTDDSASGICPIEGSSECTIDDQGVAAGIGDAAKTGDTVEVEYVGKFLTGVVFDTNIKEVAENYNMTKQSYQPLKFKIGQKSMIKGFEDGVIGMKVGEEKVIKIPSEEAYGQKRPELIYPMTFKNFTVNFPKVENITAGVKVTFPYNGQLRSFFIHNVTENSSGKYVMLDFNNPMAGEDLEFYIKIVSITP